MAVLVVGASGATGRLLVAQLLARGQKVKAIVRAGSELPAELERDSGLTMVRASVHDLSDDALAEHVRGCEAVASCLGHNLSVRGMFGQPRRLVTDVTRRVCDAIRANAAGRPVRFVLMNTTANRNGDAEERISFGQRCVVGLLRVLLPPHADNEQAADYLRTVIGQDERAVEWVAVRPDGLIDAEAVSGYEVHRSPTRSAIFDAGKTSRVNVADFMAELITNDALWGTWKGQMPVIYDRQGT